MRLLSVIVILLIGAGVIVSSCTHYPTNPPTTKCDTCCDTCHTIDTTKHPCDTCNIDKDSAAHAFIWTEYNIPGETSLTGVWVFGPDNIIIMGNNLWQYDGATFTKTHTKDLNTGLSLDNGWNGTGLFAFTPNDYWGFYSSAVYHTDDGWVFDFQQPGGTFNAGWGTSSNDMFFVGNGGQIHHYDGSKFTNMISPTTKKLSWVWGTSHNDVWASGYNSSTDESVLIHFDGTTWKEDAFSVSEQTRQYGIGGVWSCDSNGHTFAAISGTKVLRKTDNGSWRLDTAPLHNEVPGGFNGIGIYGNTPNDMMAIGGWGYVAHWNGKTWKKYDELYNYGDPSFGPGAFHMKGNTACVVGRRSGGSWVAIGRRK